MNQTEPSDKVLLDRIRLEDDQEAFTLLFRRHWHALYRLVLQKAGDDGQAQDLVQEIFIHLWENRRKLVITHSLKHYLGGMVRFQLFDYYRQSRRHQEQLLQLGHYLEQADQESGDEKIRERAWQEAHFDQAVNNLPERIREVYLLRARNSYSYEKIAQQLNIKQQTARNAYSRALTLLYESTSSTAFLLFLFYHR